MTAVAVETKDSASAALVPVAGGADTRHMAKGRGVRKPKGRVVYLLRYEEKAQVAEHPRGKAARPTYAQQYSTTSYPDVPLSTIDR